MRTVTVDWLTLTDSRHVRDADGLTWVLVKLTGWNGGASVDGPTQRRPGAHGLFAERAWRGGLSPIVDGAVYGPRPAVSRAVLQLSALLADGRLGEMTVTDLGPLTAGVRLAAEPLIDDAAGTAARFQFQLLAPDPLRYGPPTSVQTPFPAPAGGLAYPLYTDGAGATTGWLDYGEYGHTGRVTVSNPGTADTWPQFTVAGEVDAAGFEIARVRTADRLVFPGPVPAGSTLVLDSATGAVLLDGFADRGGLLTHRGWAPIPAGGSAEYAFIPRGADLGAFLTVTARPAFW